MVIKDRWSLVKAHSPGNMKGKPSERNADKDRWSFLRSSFTWEHKGKTFRWSMVRVHSHGNMKGKPSERNGHESQVVLGEVSFMLDYEEKAFRWSLVRVHLCWTMKRKPSGGPWWGFICVGLWWDSLQPSGGPWFPCEWVWFIHMRIWRESLQKRMILKAGWPLIGVSPSGRSFNFIRVVCHWGGPFASPEVSLYLWIWSKMPQADTLVDGGRHHMVSRQHPCTWNKQVAQSHPSCIESHCPVCLPCCCSCWKPSYVSTEDGVEPLMKETTLTRSPPPPFVFLISIYMSPPSWEEWR